MTKDYLRFHMICFRSNLLFNSLMENYFPNLDNCCMVVNMLICFIFCLCRDRMFYTKSNLHHYYPAHNENYIHPDQCLPMVLILQSYQVSDCFIVGIDLVIHIFILKCHTTILLQGLTKLELKIFGTFQFSRAQK